MVIEFFVYVFIVGIIVASLAYFGDRFEKEPLFRIFSAIILGITSTLIIVTIKKIIPLPEYGANPSWTNTLLVSYFTAGFFEELAKISVVLGIIYKWDDLNDWYDGPLYAGLVGIGFSLSENIGYMMRPLVNAVAENADVGLGSLRLLALESLLKYRIYPGHFLFGFITGYFIAKAKLHSEKRERLKEATSIVFGFMLAVFLHGTFNVFAVRTSFAVFLGYVLILSLISLFLGWKSLRKSLFRPAVLETLPPRKKNRLKEILIAGREEKITFGYVVMLGVLIIIYQFFVYTMTTFLMIL